MARPPSGVSSVGNSPIPRFDSLLGQNQTHSISSDHGEPETGVIVAAADSTTQDLERSLGEDDLGGKDLEELRKGFPDLRGGRALETASSSGYPESALFPNLYNSVPESGNNFSSINGNLQSFDPVSNGLFVEPCGHGLQGKPARPTSFKVLCCDVTDKYTGLHRMHLADLEKDMNGSFKISAAACFSCKEESVQEITVKTRMHGEVAAVVIGVRETFSYFFVQQNLDLEPCFMFLILQREADMQEGVRVCHRWLMGEQKMTRQAAAAHCLLSQTQRVTETDKYLSRQINNFEMLYLVRAEPVTIKIIHGLDAFSEKVYYIDCMDTWSVKEVKEQFLQLYRQENQVTADISAVWFSSTEKVIPDDEFLKWQEQLVGIDEADTIEMDCSWNNTIFVHFQPADSVAVKVHYKSDARRSMHMKSERVMVIWPYTTTRDLRQEIAKIIHKDPNALKLFINGRKIETDTDLEHLLTSPNCAVVVEHHKKITVTVDAAAFGNQSSQTLVVQMHKYESVAKLKQEVCSKMQVPPYMVDMTRGNVLLQEQEDLRTCRLRDTDTVQAVVLPNRVCLKVRLGSGQWKDVVVDDFTVSTIGQLKAFAESLIGRGRTTNSSDAKQEYTASTQLHYSIIFNGKMLHDDDTLRESCVTMNSRMLMISTEKRCFTAVCGRVPIFVSLGLTNSQLRREMVMSDGQKFYFDPQFFKRLETESLTSTNCADQPLIFANDTWHSLSSGLQLCPSTLKKQFPPQHRTRVPPDSEPEDSRVCTMCKSNTLPSLQKDIFGSNDPGIIHSKSDMFLQGKVGSASPTFEMFEREVAKKVTSTPGRDTGQTSVDSVDAPEPGPVVDAQVSDMMPASDLLSGAAAGGVKHPDQTHLTQSSAPGNLLPPCRGNRPSVQVNVTGPPSMEPDQDWNRQQQTSKAAVTHMSHIPGTLSPPASHQGWGQWNVCVPRHVSQHSDLPTDRPVTDRSLSSGYMSENDASARSRPSTRSMFYQESMEKDSDGRLIAQKTLRTRQQVDPEMLKFFQPTSIGLGGMAAITADNISQCDVIPASVDQAFLPPDSTFAYINKKIIIAVANEIGRDGQRLVLRLGVPDRVFAEAEASYGGKPFQIHYHCLRVWCQKSRARATVAELSKALEELERFDLKETVEKIDASCGYQTC